MLKNVREQLVMGNKKLTSVSPGLIDQIYRFENINDFTKQTDLEEMMHE